tara:strand:- start:5769 stop:6221 length:453 start_codon:yes stop_codon:yes gene_type:complete
MNDWQDILKQPALTPEEEQEIQSLMRFRNMDRASAERSVRRKSRKMGQVRQPVGRLVKGDIQEILKFKRRFKKVIRNKKTGRTKTVKYGQAGKAKDGKDRIRPSTKKGDAYCARSMGIKRRLPKEKRNDPNSPNNLSRKKWKCRGTKSMR